MLTLMTRKKVSRNIVFAVCIILIMGVLSACGTTNSSAKSSAGASGTTAATDATATPSPGTSSSGSTSQTPSNTSKPLTKVSLVLNWFPEPEHGGNFAAKAEGYYKEGGLDMTLMPGGPSVSSTQIVAAGKAQFGMANADDILVARDEGIPLVAIATSFQTSPQALFYHLGSGIKSFSDLNGHKVYVASTASYWLYMKNKFHLNKAQEMKYTGSLVPFLNDPNSVIQGYVTSEAYTLNKKGVKYGTLLNADSGYNIYAGVYFTTEKMIKDHPDQVKAFVDATVKGWNYYKDHYEEINPDIQKMNPDMSLAMMKFSSQNEMKLVFGGDAATKGTGVMTTARWSQLQDQLFSVGVLKKKEDISNAFTTQFLPKASK